MRDNTSHSSEEVCLSETDTAETAFYKRRDVLKATGSLAALPVMSNAATAEKPSDGSTTDDEPKYEPTWESLGQHEIPDWYDDAKLGIFLHWGAYSVPAWAPVGEYAEWYPYNMHFDGSPTNEYHHEHYGDPLPDDDAEEAFEYKDFIRKTDTAEDPEATENFTADEWDPDRWAEFFDDIGAGYIIPVAEHHDGFAMWDTDITDWNAAQMGPKRDIITELADAARARGMKFAGSYHRMFNYYDPRYTGLFGNPHYDSSGPDDEFVEKWKDRWHDLMDHVKPDILWWDGDWMAPVDVWDSKQVVADYLNTADQEWHKEVTYNDRLGQVRGEHGDFFTPEYEKYDVILEHKWESTRGIGYSFGYNRQEGPDDYLTVEELVQSFVDIVSKNGNLLLNAGPMENGRIPKIQKKRLEGLGEWLDVNGEAVFGTDYWVEPEDKTNGVEVRYTTKYNNVYAIMFDWPGNIARLDIPKYVDMHPGFKIEMLGVGHGRRGHQFLDWHVDGDELVVQLPDSKPTDEHTQHAYSLKIQVTRGPNENAYEHASENIDDNSNIVRSKEKIQDIVQTPDLVVEASDIAVAVPNEGTDTLHVAATIHNKGHTPTPETSAHFLDTTGDDQMQLASRTVPPLPVNGSITTSFDWDISGLSAGVYEVQTVVDPVDQIDEISEKNNIVTTGIGLPLIELAGKWQFHRGDDMDWKAPGFDDSGWETVNLPSNWEDHSDYTKDSAYGWYRKTISIPDTWRGYDLMLPLGQIDDVDETFFNGTKIGQSGDFPEDIDGSWAASNSAWQTVRKYSIPSDVVNFGGENVIAVRVYDGQGGGGLYAGPLGPIGVSTNDS